MGSLDKAGCRRRDKLYCGDVARQKKSVKLFSLAQRPSRLSLTRSTPGIHAVVAIDRGLVEMCDQFPSTD
jgi:hypothetical protein